MPRGEAFIAVLLVTCLCHVAAMTTRRDVTATAPYDSDGHGDHGNDSHHGNDSGHESHGVQLASLHFEYVREPLIITIFLIVVAACKLGFHHANFLSSKIPESCLLIILGVIVGAILHFSLTEEQKSYFEFSSDLFFLYLLPPIILESAYSLHDRVFFDNLGTILLFAVVGTIMNCFLLSPILYGLAICGAMGTIQITLIQCFVFGSLIVAVDPVAVLAIFQEIGVNNVLYFLVFGESLLNDAVTVVLYNTMREFNKMDTIPPEQILLGIASFFTISLGGLAIGIVVGALSAIFTRFTRHVRVVEPLAIFSLAYLSYLLAELFHFSGIISIIGCGLMQAQYAFHNLSHKSMTTVKYFGKMLSATCDSVIFLFLGLALVDEDHTWHTGFILWSVFLCLVLRFAIVYFLTFLANKINRLRKVDWEEQFIMAYGGLRGAVAFSLIAMISTDELPKQNLFQTATLVVIIFTVFVQGISIKPLVKLLRISKAEKTPVSIYEEINEHVTDHVMAGIEEICGHIGHNFIRERLDYFDNKYIRKILMRDPTTKDGNIMELYHRIAIQMHFENTAGCTILEDFTSDLELYKPNLVQIPALPEDMNSDAAHMAMDTQTELTKRASAMNPMYGRYSLFSRGYSMSGFGMMSFGDAPGSRSSKISQTRSRSGTGMSDDVFDEQNRSKDKPTLGTVGKRKSVLSRVFSREEPEDIIQEPSATDVRRWLVKNPTNDVFHRKYDRNLTTEDNSDLVYHLQEKGRRTLRHRVGRAGSAFVSPATSPYGGSPVGSNVDLRMRTSMLDVIQEGQPISREGSHLVPPRQPPRKRGAAGMVMSSRKRSAPTESPSEVRKLPPKSHSDDKPSLKSDSPDGDTTPLLQRHSPGGADVNPEENKSAESTPRPSDGDHDFFSDETSVKHRGHLKKQDHLPTADDDSKV